LSFSSCFLDAEAAEKLVAFFQTPLFHRNGAVACESSLREFSYGYWKFGGESNRLGLVSMLAMQTLNTLKQRNGALHSTIGSQVSTLAIERLSSFGDYVDAMASNAPQLRFTSLRVYGMSTGPYLHLLRSASDLPLLRELSIGEMGDISAVALILPSLRGNGTLHCLNRSGGEDEGSDDFYYGRSHRAGPFGESAMKLVNAYCQRNQCIEQLIGSNVFEDSSNGYGDGDITGSSDTSEPWLYPVLLCTARQVPKSYMQLLLSSLIVRGDSVGQQVSGKRAAVGTAGGARKSNRRRNAC
jgi:hypothetical protein